MALDTINPFIKSPETCIAKFIPQEEHLTAGSKQSGCKQSLLWHPSAFPLSDKLLSNLKHRSVKANSLQPKQAAYAILLQQAILFMMEYVKLHKHLE